MGNITHTINKEKKEKKGKRDKEKERKKKWKMWFVFTYVFLSDWPFVKLENYIPDKTQTPMKKIESNFLSLTDFSVKLLLTNFTRLR